MQYIYIMICVCVCVCVCVRVCVCVCVCVCVTVLLLFSPKINKKDSGQGLTASYYLISIITFLFKTNQLLRGDELPRILCTDDNHRPLNTLVLIN